MTLRAFVEHQVAALIDGAAAAALKAEHDPSDEGVHDLRVAIRRLSENLRVFEDVFPETVAKSVRKELREAMKLAGEARNHDIAVGLMQKAEIEPPPEMAEARTKAEQKLAAVLSGWNASGTPAAWRQQLRG